MLAPEFKIEDDFPPASYEQWRALVEADLKGADFEQELVTLTYEGIDIQPLYTRRDQLDASEGLRVRGLRPTNQSSVTDEVFPNRLDLRQEHAHPDLKLANQAILDDLNGGVTSICVQFDSAAQRGIDPDDPDAIELPEADGVAAYTAGDLDALFAGVDLSLIGIALASGGAFLPTAAMLIGLWRQRGVAHTRARGAFNADPLGALAGEGILPVTAEVALAQLGKLAAWTSQNYPNVTAVGVDTSVYHHAGAMAVQDIGYGVATGVEYLRAMVAAGMEIDQAARQIEFNFRLGTHHFLAIAKLRAAHRIWSRIIEASGGSQAAGIMRIHSCTSRRVLTQRDPYVNLLRNTVCVFTAMAAGADWITSAPLDVMLGMPDEFSRRVARNIVLILQEEAHLYRVLDPAGGSWFLDQLTEQIAEKAWSVFQEVEREGGMLKALQSGVVHQQIEAVVEQRTRGESGSKEEIYGAGELKDALEGFKSHPEIDRAAIRRASIRRIEKWRASHAGLVADAASLSSIDSIAAAAGEGASIGQLARALGFHKNRFEIEPLKAGDSEELREQLGPGSEALRNGQIARGKKFSS